MKMTKETFAAITAALLTSVAVAAGEATAKKTTKPSAKPAGQQQSAKPAQGAKQPAAKSAAKQPAAAPTVKASFLKPYSMIADAAKMIEEGAEPPENFMFKAALAASWAGENVKSRDFLAYFLEKDKSSSTEVRRALVRMCLAGGDPKYYERYLASYPHDLDALYIGLCQLARFVSDSKSRDYTTQLQLLIDAFPEGEELDAIVRSCNWAVFDTNSLGISDGKQTLKVFARSTKWKMIPRLAWFLNRLTDRGPECFDVYRTHKDTVFTKEFYERLAQCSTTPEDAGVEICRKICTIYGIDKNNPNAYLDRFGRLHKQPNWMALVADAKSGKFPEKPTVDYFVANRRLSQYINDWRNNKFKDNPSEALKRAGAVFDGVQNSDFIDIGDFRWFVEKVTQLVLDKPELAKDYPFEKFASWAFERPFHDREMIFDMVMKAYDVSGRTAEGFARVRKASEKPNAGTYIATWRLANAAHCTVKGGNWDRTILKGCGYDWQKKSLWTPKPEVDMLAWNLETQQKYAKAAVPELVCMPDMTGCWVDPYWRIEVGAREAKREQTPEEKKYRADAERFAMVESTLLVPNGMKRRECPWGHTMIVDQLFYKGVKENPRDIKNVYYAATMSILGRGEWRDLVTACETMLANDMAEVVYLITSRYREIDRVPELQKLRTEAAAKMPGLYPVSDKDPAYPLYVAADALQRNNPERAWTLLSANTKIFDKDPMRYQPQFALWALDQYRKVRGPNDSLRDRAWDHVEALLQKESSLPTDIAAGLFLLRAQIAEDRLQYEVAHAGYQALRNHKTYGKTPAGRQAMFRDVELLMAMGASDGAQQTAEQWITMPETDVRAQGHYILAKIAFSRKDYDETREELDKVFEIDFTHAEARLLQGEWKLATNYEVDDTQVLLGDLADRSAIRPGQPLSISVQDKNLSVAGGGSSIPVMVTTSAGKDQEKVLLYPGTRDPSLFRGSIDTVLGPAKPGNSTLELVGDDRVSYRIDPTYLKSRGLKADKPKVLTVVDDADMVIGNGKEDQVLKPGLPLHVKLVDRDRSRSGGASEVTVSVVTTSGDKLPAAKLQETGVATGTFVADIKTAIPPPRSFASDSTAGSGPQDLISTTRSGVWQSLSDGVKPKSVGVDTMSSYLVNVASIEMPQPETIARMRLWGSLYGDEILLGTYPEEKPETRRGIHVINMQSNARNRTDFMRELSKKFVTPLASEKWGVVRSQGGHSGLRHVIRGTVCLPEDQTLRLRLRGLVPDQKNPNDTMRWLTLEFFVDGVRVFGGMAEHDMNYKNKSHPCSIDAGIHDFEIYANTCRPTDSFELCIEKDDGELVAMPADWLDETAHPELTARFTDKCKIARGKGGFSATFAEPERLRLLRWEFIDFTGNSVSASKLTVTAKDGKQVVPSAHDFTEALGNDILEVAPGDDITVTYEDDVTSSGRARAVERTISSSFHDATIDFKFEELSTTARGQVQSQFFAGYRVAPGDTVFVSVKDPDLDVTRGPDTVKIEVSTTGGSKITLDAVERTEYDREGKPFVRPEHTGVFTARVRTALAPTDGKALPPDVLPMKEGEGIVASYYDEDNTDPGVPVQRTATLESVPPSSSQLTLSHTWAERGEDKSPEGNTKLLTIRRRAESANATHVWRTGYYGQMNESGEAAIVTPETEIVVNFRAPAIIRHAGSSVNVQITTKSEIDAAENEGRDVEWQTRRLQLKPVRTTTSLRSAGGARVASATKKRLPDTLHGVIDLYSSAAEERAAAADEDVDLTIVKQDPINLIAGDELIVRYCEKDSDEPIAEAKAKVGTTAWIGLADATYEANNPAVHLGESFHLMVIDPDRDVSPEQDEIEVGLKSKKGEERVLTLRETMPRSGVFTCPITPSIVVEKPAEAAPAVAASTKPETKGEATEGRPEADNPTQLEDEAIAADTTVVDDEVSNSVFPSCYGDELTFTYDDQSVGFSGTPGARTVTGNVLPGSDGSVRSYSKRFRDADQAVLVQFRLAECLFEMAKDFRKLKDAEKSANAISDGRKILEDALRDYPNTSHAAEGEFLLANLYEQLAEEERQSRMKREKDGEDLSQEPDKSDPLYREAAARFSAILSAWPEGEYAARSQYHKALCLERLGDFARAGEEYVKMTYLFPESPLVGDASVRLASYYYTKEKRYDIAGKIYTSFRNRFPAHPQAPNALFMGGQCLVKRAETLAEQKDVKGAGVMITEAYHDAVASFVSLVDNYKDIPNKELLAQGLYWAGDISFRLRDYPNAYIYLKRTTFEYPESKWARYARGMLLQESKTFDDVAQ